MMFKNEKTRKIFGILWFVFFAYLLYSIGVNSGSGKFSIRDYIQDKLEYLSGYFGKNGSANSLNTVVRQEVVQEESAITQVVDRVSPAVVSIVAKTAQFDLFNGPVNEESGIGTGFIVDSKGLIVTNSHVVDNPDAHYSIVLKDGRSFEVAKVHLDQNTDLAILEVTSRDLPIVEFGDSDKLKVGQRAIAIGNALGEFQNTTTVGVVSGIGRHIEAGGFGTVSKIYDSVIQTDAALNPGNSGGPLLNSAGQVIGVNVATTPGADNISFAIPVNTLKPVLEGFLKEGRIIHAYIGVYYEPLTKQKAALYNFPEGAYISGVIRGSPAEKAGLKRGDIIVKLDGKDLAGGALGSALSKYKVGDTVTLTIDRERKTQDTKVTLEEAPQRPADQ
jgi:serine protease Do